ncbi:hypothetical protein BGW39_000748 [Mortierella sp. 14UC]|nr:hypothetical protein BGW39_000748 [Mortierella sp. 14UC]
MDTPIRKRSPLDLPELLDHIFSFLSDHTITHTVILVCQHWLQIAQHRVMKELVWQSSTPARDKDRLLSWLGRVDRLCYHAHSERDDPYADSKLWDALAERSRQHRFLDWEQQRANFTRRQQQQQQWQKGDEEPDTDEGTSELPLKELRIQGYIRLSNLKPVFPAVAHLTSLEIHTMAAGVLSMQDVLENCPLLQRICVQSATTTAHYLQGPWFSPVRINPRTGLARKRAPLSLRSVILKNVIVPQLCLETLIPITPHLSELVLVVETFVNRYGSAITSITNDDDDTLATDGPTRIRQLVKLHHPHLRSFYFLPPHTDLTTDMLQDWIRDSPQSKLDWTIEGSQLTTPIVAYLVKIPNFITTLHISGACSTLHDYLCASPHLLHLKAPLTAMPIDAFDIHHRWTQGRLHTTTIEAMIQNQQRNPHRPRFWACRRLQTLHLAFSPVVGTPLFSRLIFGYIARICPRLRDLEVHGSEHLLQDPEAWMVGGRHYGRLCLTLDGGLCLLSKLNDLERLVVGSTDHNVINIDENSGSGGDGSGGKVDFDWMISAGHSAARRRARQAWINKTEGRGCWATRLLDEEADDEKRLLNYQRALSMNGIAAVIHQENEGEDVEVLGKELQNLGLLKDVKQVLEEMDGKEEEGYKCWPQMIRLSIYQEDTFGQNPEAEFKRLLASIDS